MRRLILLFLGAAVLFSVSCIAAPRKKALVPSDVSAGKVILVGKIVLHPAFAKGEQRIKTLGAENYINKTFIINDEKLKSFKTPDLNKNAFLTDLWSGRVEADIGETFYAVCPGGPLYLYACAVVLKVGLESTGNQFYLAVGNQRPATAALTSSIAYFPMNIRVDIKPGDRAVYLGTFHYYRNEFNQFVKVKVQNDYNAEYRVFRDKFGDIPLRKAAFARIRDGGYIYK